MGHDDSTEVRLGRRMFRYGIAALALTAGIAYGSAPGIAAADSPDNDTGTSAASGPADSGPESGTAPSTSGPADDDSADTRVDESPVETDDEPTEVELETGAEAEVEVEVDTETEAEVEVETGETATEADEQLPEPPTRHESATENAVEQPDSTTDIVKPEPPAGPVTPTRERPPAAVSPVALSAAVATQTETARMVEVTTASVPAVSVATAATVETTAPVAPQPLSPIAELLELPGRIVNMVLEVLDFTSYAGSPTLPFGLGPINDLIFGAFREIERLLGLWDTPPAQPVVPTLVYDGPTDRVTPTVAQFLHAATAAYVLGSTPAGLQPFVVDGFQMAETNIFTGMVGKAWVTPEGQVIIAYQGTTGGTHLLFNPLMVIPQLIADLQVVFTRTTPWAFHNALDFAQRVRAEAALQGYDDADIFVTGHSLGGWEAQYVAQQTGLSGIGFEAPGINTTVPGNGADSMFVNIGTYGSTAPFMATDLPGLQPFMPPFSPGGGSKPHFGPMVMIGDPAAMTPLYNASTLWGESLIGSAIFLLDFLGNFFQYHLPGVQAYHLDIIPDPGVVPFLGTARGPVHQGYGELTIPMLLARASDDGILFQP